MRAHAWITLFVLALTHACTAQKVVVASYNLENYLGAEQASAPGRQAHPKTEHVISAEVQIIKGRAPDILGVCEMGRPEQFADFQRRLAEAGLGYTDSEYVQAADPDRHLALVSRYPIVSRQSQANVTYDLRALLVEKNIFPCLALNGTRKERRFFHRGYHRHRHHVENLFQSLKRHRRVATRYEKLATSFAAFVTLSAILHWLE